MASSHGMAVIKNLCYTAPRRRGSDKPTTENERLGRSIEADGIEGDISKTSESDKRLSSNSRQGRKSKRSVRESLSQSLRDLEDVDENDFYDHLVALKNEHKKTLKAVEKLYYTEREKQRSGFALDGGTKIAVNDRELPPENVPLSEFYPFEVDFRDFGENGRERFRGDSPVRPEDHVRDMSVREDYEETWNKESEGDSTLESEEESRRRSFSDPTDTVSPRRPRPGDGTVIYKEMYPRRSSALDVVEDMWEGFSVYDYPADASPPREEQVKKQEWTPQITIPKPFSMTVREAKKKAKHKTRSQLILEEDLKKKQEKEEAELYKKFRAQPVPATTFLPLYDEIVRQNELRRYHVRELSKAILKSTEKPFKFIKREEERKKIRRTKSLGNISDFENKMAEKKKKFKANPFPEQLFDLTLEDKMTEKEEYREIKMRMRAQEMLASSRLPPNMEARGQEYTLGHFRSKLRKKGNKNAFMTKEHRFKPKINPDIPDFDDLHRQFEKEMRNKKRDLEPTVIEPFNLRTAHVSSARKARLSRSVERNDGKRTSNRSISRERPASARLSSPNDTLPLRTTESTRLRESTVRKSLEERRAVEQEEVKEEQRRRRRQMKLKPEVTRKVMANDHSGLLKKAAKEKLQSYRISDRARKEEYSRELKEMQQRINKRPLLFEQQTQLTARRAAERKYADILRSAGVDETLVENLVTKDGKIVDADSDDDFEDTASQPNYNGSRRSSGAEPTIYGETRNSYDKDSEDFESDVSEEIEGDKEEM